MSAFPAFLTAGTFFHAVSIIQRKTMLFKNYYGILLRKITRNGMLEEAETVRFVWIMKERNHEMKVCGIIAEYNPFHKGHAYQLKKIREDLRADYILIAMSGDFVQRGEPALLEKHLRAEMALRCGADLVLELPVRVSTASAEGFADGAMRLLASLGVVTHVCFGAETDSPLLHRIADLLAGESPEFRRILSSFLSEGFSMPAAREETAAACLQDPEVRKILRQPNNILAVEYLKSIRRNGLTCEPWILIREGEGYHSEDLNDQTFASASAIRKALQTGSLEQALAFLPDPVKEILSKASVQDTFLFDKDLDSLLFYRLFCEDEDSLIQYADVDADLARRILRYRNEYQSFSSFADKLGSRSLTRSHTRRALLHIVFQVKKNSPEGLYGRVLGFRRESAPLLSAIKKNASSVLITKQADAVSLLSSEQQHVFLETTSASNLCETIRSAKSGAPFRHEYSRPVVIL